MKTSTKSLFSTRKTRTRTCCWLSHHLEPALLLFLLVASAQVVPMYAQDPPINDHCSDAILVVPGADTNGDGIRTAVKQSDSTNASYENQEFVMRCGDTDEYRGVWYKFQGTGGNVLISTCDVTSENFSVSNAQFDTILSIFEGTCTEPGTGCLRSDDTTIEEQTTDCSSAQIATTVGQNYLVHIHGYQGASGEFLVTFLFFEPEEEGGGEQEENPTTSPTNRPEDGTNNNDGSKDENTAPSTPDNNPSGNDNPQNSFVSIIVSLTEYDDSSIC